MHLKHIDSVGPDKAKLLHSLNLESVEAVARANYSYVDRQDGLSGELVGRAQSALPEWDHSRRFVESNRQESAFCEYCGKEFKAVKFQSAESNRSVHEMGCNRATSNNRPMKDYNRQFGQE